jgi:hypothetical protein
MNNQTAFKLLEEIRQQCRFAQFAFQNVRTSLNALDQEKVFFFVHAFLNHAWQVSRILWPARTESSARGEFLRCELKVPDSSPLFLREMRPHLERPDEWLEQWMESLASPGFVDMNIMPQGTISEFKPDAFQRSLDPETLRLTFRDDPCDLRPVAAELQKIEAASQSWLRTHNPW